VKYFDLCWGDAGGANFVTGGDNGRLLICGGWWPNGGVCDEGGRLAYTGGMSDGKEEREERERRQAEEKAWEREDRVERGEPEWEPAYGE